MEAIADHVPLPKMPPDLPVARGYDRLSDCELAEGFFRLPSETIVHCWDRELPAALEEDPELKSTESQKRLAGLRKQYAELDALRAKNEAGASEFHALIEKLKRRTVGPVVVFGMTIGKAFKLPICTFDNGNIGYTICWWRPPVSLMGRQVLFASGMAPNWVKPLSYDQAPVGAAASLDVEILNGRLEAMYIPTVGLQFQDLVIAVLKDKFGPPVTAETVLKQNAFGAKFQVAFLHWQIGDVTVLFDGGNLDGGEIVIRTLRAKYTEKLKKNF